MAQDPPDSDDDTPRGPGDEGERNPLPDSFARARFDERIVALLAAAQQFRESIALLLIDLDHFAKFNAEHGRPAGDAALMAIHRRVLSSVGANDLVTRFGGDDFAVLCKSSIRNYGPMLAQRLCSRISGGAVKIPGAADAYFVTASVGVSFFPGRGVSTPIDLVTTAEDALRRAKAGGRNRVFVTNDPLAEDP